MNELRIGNVYRAVGDLKSALLFYEEATISYVDLKNHEGALQSLSNKAAGMDIELTEFFVERWTLGEALEIPCR
jgi:hypothetical protein